jgi:GntP family gluconate:H+ symporter
MTIAGMAYAKWLGKRIYQLPADDGEGWIRPQYQEPVYESLNLQNSKELPSAFAAFAPIIVPVLLILLNTITSALKTTGTVADVIKFLGSPVIAVGIGLLIAIYALTGRESRKTTIAEMEKGIKAAGIIILVTGGGGALGQVLRDSGAGNYIAEQIANTSLPAILLPFIVASLVRLIQGSGTVAMITSASITAPIIATLGVNPLFAALAASMGSICFSYFNDSYYWVVNRMLGVEEAKEQIRVWSLTTTIVWAVGLVELLIVNAIFG